MPSGDQVNENGDKKVRIEYFTEGLPKPVHYPSKEDRQAAARELLASGQVKIHLVDAFNTPDIVGNITQALLVNPWALPSAELGNELPLQASSAQHAVPTTLIYDSEIPGYNERVDVVAKPFLLLKSAHREFEKLQEVRSRGIETVNPLGLVENQNGRSRALLLTVLKRGTVPLSVVNLEGIRFVNGDKKIKDLLAGLGAFVSDFQNKGLRHNDLHPGNIGLNLGDESTKSFTLFDLASAQWVGADKLNRLQNNMLSQRKLETMNPSSTERAFYGDAAKLLSGIVLRNPNINQQFIKSAFMEGYLNNRLIQGGRIPSSWMQEFEKIYREKFSQQSKALYRVQHQRKANTS